MCGNFVCVNVKCSQQPMVHLAPNIMIDPTISEFALEMFYLIYYKYFSYSMFCFTGGQVYSVMAEHIISVYSFRFDKGTPL